MRYRGGAGAALTRADARIGERSADRDIARQLAEPGNRQMARVY